MSESPSDAGRPARPRATRQGPPSTGPRLGSPVPFTVDRRLIAWGLAILAALVAAWQLRPLISWTPAQLATHGLLADDAFFYSVLARNFERYGFLTLDGEMPTNGVQPLWMALQILLVKLLPRAHEAALLAWSSWAVYVLTCLVAVRLLARGGTLLAACRATFVAGLVLLNPRFQAWTVQGLETPLVLLWFVLLIEVLDRAAGRDGADHRERANPPGPAPSSGSRLRPDAARSPRSPLAPATLVLMGTLAALCFLTRTDQFWPAICIGAWVLLRGRGRLRSIALYAAPLLLLVLPYLLHNLRSQGGLMQVSGQVKSYYVEVFFTSAAQYLSSDEWWALVHAFSNLIPIALPLPVIWTLLVLLAAFLLAWRRGPDGHPQLTLRLFSLAVLTHALTLYIFYRELMTRNAYYFAPTVLWAAYVFARALPEPREPALARPLATRLRRPRAWVASVAAAGALLILALASPTARVEPQPYWLKRMQLAEDIRRFVPPGEHVGAFWPGVFAQFCGRPVTPLDGVVGSRSYLEDYIKRGRELDYMLERDRPYLAVHLPMYPDSLLAADDIPVPTWTRLGVRRIWERRDSLHFEVLSANRVAKGEGGWCLLRMEPKNRGEPR
ncbi:MAG: hypothetical protein V1774_00615 [Candidatus Eisenbacteria bacterium]